MAWRLWDREERLATAADRWLARLHKDSSPETVRAFHRWRDRDPARAAAVTEAEANWRRLGNISPPAAARARQADQPRATAPSGWPVGKLAFGTAAAVVVAVGGDILLRDQAPQPTNASSELIADAMPRLIHLRDGSTVILDIGSAITARFDGRSRDIKLERGRARFDVFHDAAHPFVVRAGDRIITAKGTVFDVARTASRVSVAMLEGVVEVRRVGEPASTQHSVRLAAGQMLVAQASAQTIAPVLATAEDWTGKLQSLDGLPLGEILARANRTAGKPIILADPALQPLHLQGQLPTSNTKMLAEQLAAALDLDLRDEPDGYVLSPRKLAPNK